MKKLRVIVLMHESLVPPESTEGFSEEEILEWKTEFDVVTTLRGMGHEVVPVGVNDDLGVIRRAMAEVNPHVAFNLLEEFHGVGVYDHHVVSYLELMKQQYTGCNPRGILLANDKPLSKRFSPFIESELPNSTCFPRGRKPRRPKTLQFPLLVKSVSEDASLGITQSSVVHDDDKLVERIQFVHDELETDALVERYIEGREMYVGVLGNRRVTVLPIWEMVFQNAPEGMPQIATARVKWDLEYQQKLGIETLEAKNLTPEVEQRIIATCKRIYKALSLSGYARMDLRLSDDGQVYVLEANPNPNLSFGEDFAESAEKVGINYEQLLQKIITLGMNYEAEWRLV